MIAKLGFILLVALFGALMFAAGVIAPESVRAPIASFSQRVAAKLSSSPAKAAKAGAAAKAPGAAAQAAPANAGTAAAPKEAVALDSLLLPTPLPQKGKYALQAGQFADADEAGALKDRIKDSGLASAVIPVLDKNGQRWFVVAAGSFDSIDDARTQRWPISRNLGKSEPLPLILLPQEKAKT